MANQSKSNRRKFISNSLKGSLALGIGFSSAAPLLQSFSTKQNTITGGFKTGFNQELLPYSYDALESIIDATTMELHYSKHAAGYSKNVKEAATAENVDITKPLEDVLAKISSYSTKMQNNGGGHYNHEMFWQCMRPKTEDNKPSGKFLQTIEKHFTSFDNFKNQFANAGKTQFGSGWAWLYINKDKKLMIGSTANQDNPLMDISDIKGFPLLCLDVWEHAYYLKYQNKRADYIENWWQVVNWDYVEQRLESIK